MEDCWQAERFRRPRLPVILESLEDERLNYVMPLNPSFFHSATKEHPYHLRQRDNEDSDIEDEEEKEDVRYRG